ncbi:MAG: hypothetical protein ABSF71_05120 [Terriglobia bacterium]|jgi:hypothetical protein
MSAKRNLLYKLSVAVGVYGLAIGLLAGLNVLMSGTPAIGPLVGVMDDWTHHHVVFSNPGTAAEALGKGHFTEWYRTVTDPRYTVQQMKRAGRASASVSSGPTPEALTLLPNISDLVSLSSARGGPPPKKSKLSKDWVETLGTYSPTSRVGGEYPAKFSFNSPAACSDWVMYTTGGATSTATATVVAYKNLYGTSGPSGTGCGAGGSGGAVPQIAWAYNTSNGTASNATLSPIIDLAGDQVAYIQSTSTAASLVILKPLSTSGGTVAAPAAATFAANASYKACGAPCYTTIALYGTVADTTSAPYYDYGSDTIWVGDGSGNLHKFINVFLGSTTPTESGTPFKSAVSTSPLTSPVYDSSTGLVFVGDTGTATPFHSVCAVTGINAICATVGTVTTSGTISGAVGTGEGMNDAPIVDSSASKAYVFIGIDNTSNCLASNGTTATACSAVYQYTTTSSINTQTPVKAILGRGMQTPSSVPLYSGAFNGGYYTGGSASGALYVLGGAASGAYPGVPTLYKITVTNGTMASSSTTGPTLTSQSTNTGSPVTEFLNGSNDYLFLSVTPNGTASGCTGACLYGYTIPATFTTSLAPNAVLNVTGGASGTIIDNTGSLAGASQIYFYSLAAESCPSTSSGCAVQASQALP